jgi:hypothetical protein
MEKEYTCARCKQPLSDTANLDPRGAIDGKPSYMHGQCARDTVTELAAARHDAKQRLAAAAPGLLATLEDVKLYLEINKMTGRIIYKPVCSAITKAKGA